MQNLRGVVSDISESNIQYNSIGLITGCFDILHIGHINLIREAKKHVDILVIGLENDSTIKISKGIDRPINTLSSRYEMLSELKSVDYVFPVEPCYKFGTKEASKIQEEIISILSPTHIFTTPEKDKHILERRGMTERLGIKLVEIEMIHDISSTSMIR